jgi:hypothetical protein
MLTGRNLQVKKRKRLEAWGMRRETLNVNLNVNDPKKA